MARRIRMGLVGQAISDVWCRFVLIRDRLALVA